MNELTPEKYRRLALIRELYLRGVEQSQLAGPVGAASILAFHDAVELFAHMAATHQGLQPQPNARFVDYWKSVEGLQEATPMDALNRARVGLKHHGIFPDALSVESLRAAVTAFFRDSTPPVFGVEFDALSMVDLIAFTQTRSAIETADNFANEENWVRALIHLGFAFHELLHEFREPGASPFSEWPSFYASVSGEGDLVDDVNEAMNDLGNEVGYEVSRLEDAIELVAIGVDLRRWQQFTRWTPPVFRKSENDRPTFDPAWGAHAEGQGFGRDQFDFCREFVIDSAMRLQRSG